MGGCGPKFVPVFAGYEQAVSYEPEVGLEVGVGESLLVASGRFLQPAFQPLSPMTPSSLRGLTPGPLDISSSWINWWRLDDGTLVVQPPAGYADGYGLRVDSTGAVVGRRPWLDLRQQARPSQEPWDGRMRQIFSPTRAVPVDIFVFDLVYRGLWEGLAVIESRGRKLGAGVASSPEEHTVAVPGTFSFQGISIQLLEAGPERLRYQLTPDLP